MRNYSKTGNTYFSTRSNAQLSRNCAKYITRLKIYSRYREC